MIVTSRKTTADIAHEYFMKTEKYKNKVDRKEDIQKLQKDKNNKLK